ncbi:hypothetical protein HYX13_04425 [Candidatus Woesearchaeota archaeon]|nr:hypothetical protein [Candidatus Woesearchaeota archaeon]
MRYKTYIPYAFMAVLAFGASCAVTNFSASRQSLGGLQERVKQEIAALQDSTPVCTTLPILQELGDYTRTTCVWDKDADGFPERKENTFYQEGKPVVSETRNFQWNVGTSSLARRVYSPEGDIVRLELDYNNDLNLDEVIEYATTIKATE